MYEAGTEPNEGYRSTENGRASGTTTTTTPASDSNLNLGSSGKSVNNNQHNNMPPDVSRRLSSERCDDVNGGDVSGGGDVAPLRRSSSDCENRLKCVLLGDGAVGKTSLVVSYTTDGYPTEYIPTAYDNYSVSVKISDRPIRLQICDTAGQDEFDGMRPLCYPDTEIFLVCFSVVRPVSLCNIRDKWLAEMKKHQPKVPFIMVGTQTDLRNNLDILVDLAKLNERPVEEEEARQFAKRYGAAAYVECSALTQKNLKEVFDTAILEGIGHKEKKEKKKRSWSMRRNESTKSEKREAAQRKAKSVRRKSVVWWRRYFCFS